MATPKPKQPDANEEAAKAVREATGSEQQSGEDLILDEQLRAQFRELKKRLSRRWLHYNS